MGNPLTGRHVQVGCVKSAIFYKYLRNGEKAAVDKISADGRVAQSLCGS